MTLFVHHAQFPPENYEVSGGELRVVNEKSHPFNVYLRSSAASDARPQGIRIEVIRSGESVYQGMLATGGEGV